jgi:hypothetical protein
MSMRQKIRATWPETSRFSKGIVTSLDNLHLGDDVLAEGTLNAWPYRLGNLGPWPAFDAFCSNWATEFGLDPARTSPKRIVGMGIWSQEPGMDYQVVAVYGTWALDTVPPSTREGTLILAFKSDTVTNHIAQNISWVSGDGPVRFSQMPLWSDALNKRVNQLVICSPYHPTQLVCIDSIEVAHSVSLPYIASEAYPWKSKLWLTGVVGFPNTVFYSGVNDVTTWDSFEVGEGDADPNLGFIYANDCLYVRKSKSIWQITSSDPANRQVLKILSRGGCVYFPKLSSQGILNCDEKGLYLSSGHYEQLVELSTQIPQIKADRKDLIPWFEQMFFETSSDFLGGTLLNDVTTENRGTAAVPIDVLTLKHDAEAIIEAQTTGGHDHAIGPTIGDMAYQTFKDSPYTSDCYWLTKAGVQLKYSGAASQVYVEVVKFLGSPSAPDEEEVLAAEVIDVTNAAYGAYVDVTLTDRTFLYPSPDWLYMIRITCLSGTTHWNYDDHDTYVLGECDWDPGYDACFHTYGYRYHSFGEWNSQWMDKTGVKRWGALLYSALEKEQYWTDRVALAYRFQYPSGTTTPWFQFPYGSGGGDIPGMGAIVNTYLAITPPATKIQFRAYLYKINEIPPFVDWILGTYSREITEAETCYPSGFEYEGKIFLAGVNPYKHGVICRNEESAVFMTGNYLGVSHFLEWRGQLWAGQTMFNPGISITPTTAALCRFNLDSDSACKFSSVPPTIRTSRKWVGEENDKDLLELFLTWMEKKGLPGNVTVYVDLITDGGKLPVSIAAADIETVDLADYEGVLNRVQKVARVSLPNWTTKTLAVEVRAVVPASIYGPIGSQYFPWFQLIRIDVDANAWPPVRFTK